LNKSLYRFKKELFSITNENLKEYKSILINLIKEENDRYDNIYSRSNYIWKNLDFKEIDYDKYLSDIYVQDIFKFYEKIFFESKILSMQASKIPFPKHGGPNSGGGNNKNLVVKTVEINKETNLYMKIVTANLDYFNSIDKIQPKKEVEDKDNDIIDNDNNNEIDITKEDPNNISNDKNDFK
jgi:hypothetical protein